MKKSRKKSKNADMLKEYDFSKGVRGKFAKRVASGTNMVALAPELTKFFPDSESVNDALRALVKIAARAK